LLLLVLFLISVFFPPSLVHLFSLFLFLTNSKNSAELTVAADSGGKKNEMREKGTRSKKNNLIFLSENICSTVSDRY